MITASSNHYGIDLFYKNSYGLLIHEWSRHPNKEIFMYRVISESVLGDPAFIYTETIIHTYFVNDKSDLLHVRIDLNNMWEKSVTLMVQNVNSSVTPVCCQLGQDLCLCFVDGKGKLMEIRQNRDWNKQFRMIVVDEKKMAKNMLKMIKIDKNTSILFYKNINHLYWTVLEKRDYTVRIKGCELPLKMIESTTHQIMLRKGVIHVFAVNEKGKVCGITISEASETILAVKQIGRQKILPQFPLMLEYQEKEEVIVRFAVSKTKMAFCSLMFHEEKIRWIQKRYTLQKQLGCGLFMGTLGGQLRIYTLDKHQILYKYGTCLPSEQLSTIPYLLWDNIKGKCQRIGGGYWSDCFLYSQLKLAVKKFIKQDHQYSHKVIQELRNLHKLELVEPNIIEYRIIDKGELIGFTIPYFKSTPWKQILQNKNSLVHKSPIVRVKLVIELAQQVRSIQSLDICHGDIHMENILININEIKGSILEPKVEVKVIDFGNSFEVVSGQLISYKGVTGNVLNLIPPEIRACFETNYDPYAFNPHQLALNALLILLREDFSEEFYAEKNVDRLEKQKVYPQELIDWVRELLHPNVSRKSEALNLDIAHFQTLTREIYLNNNKK